MELVLSISNSNGSKLHGICQVLSRPQKDISLDKNKQKNRKKGPVQWFQNLIHYPSMFFSEVKSG